MVDFFLVNLVNLNKIELIPNKIKLLANFHILKIFCLGTSDYISSTHFDKVPLQSAADVAGFIDTTRGRKLPTEALIITKELRLPPDMRVFVNHLTSMPSDLRDNQDSLRDAINKLGQFDISDK